MYSSSSQSSRDSTRSTAIFFAEAPDFSELCAVILEIPMPIEDSHVNESQINKQSTFQQPQIIRCRELIFSEPDIIATPSLNHERKLSIIMKQNLFRTGRLQARFKKMGLQAEKPIRVTPAMFNSCLQYTVEARLAPSWNRVGQLLVQGRDFLTSKQKMNAVKMELTANEKEFYLSVEAKVIKLASLKLEDLDICQPVLDKFNSQSEYVVQEYSIGNNWCHVLPSMKKGKIVSISHKLQSHGPFQSYRDIKRHWKNSYGYRLPEDADGKYFQIYFKLIGERLFTYPESCVRPRDIFPLPRTDPKPILQAFLTDLQGKISNICGQKFHFQTKASFLVTSLNDIGKEDVGRTNLTTKMPQTQHGYRQAPPSVPVFQPKPSINPMRPPANTSALTNQKQTDPTSLNCAKTDNRKNEESRSKSDLIVSESRPKIVPVFNPVKARRPTPSFSSFVKTSKPKSVPIFRPKIPKPVKPADKTSADTFEMGQLQAVTTQPTCSNELSNSLRTPMNGHLKTASLPKDIGLPRPPSGTVEPKLSTDLSRVALAPPKSASTLPQSRPAQPKSAATLQPQSQKIQPFSGLFEPKEGTLAKSTRYLNSTIASSNVEYPSDPTSVAGTVVKSSTTVPGFARQPTFGGGHKPMHSHVQHSTNTPGSKLKLKKMASNLNSGHVGKPISLNVLRLEDRSETSGLQLSQTSFQGTGVTTPMKRPSVLGGKAGDGESKPKKPRAKPTVQEGVDVTALAYNNQLNKVNAVTLTAWLKSRGIPCRAKDKKTDLVDRVKTALNIAMVEQ